MNRLAHFSIYSITFAASRIFSWEALSDLPAAVAAVKDFDVDCLKLEISFFGMAFVALSLWVPLR